MAIAGLVLAFLGVGLQFSPWGRRSRQRARERGAELSPPELRRRRVISVLGVLGVVVVVDVVVALTTHKQHPVFWWIQPLFPIAFAAVLVAVMAKRRARENGAA